MLVLSMVMIPLVVMVCIALVFFIGIEDDMPGSGGQESAQPRVYVETNLPADITHRH